MSEGRVWSGSQAAASAVMGKHIVLILSLGGSFPHICSKNLSIEQRKFLDFLTKYAAETTIIKYKYSKLRLLTGFSVHKKTAT